MYKICKVGLLSFMVSMAANAAITFDFKASGGTVGGGSPFGNTRTYTSGIYSVTVRSFSLPSNLAGNFTPAQLNQYNGVGLASCNQVEGANCSAPVHQVDNEGSYDFVQFSFNFVADPLSVMINPYGVYDKDVSFWIGTPGASLSALTLASLGMGPRMDSDDSSNPLNTAPRSVDLTSGGVGTSLLLSTRLSGNGADSNYDYFKIETLTVNTAVPEPATFGMIGAALIGLGLVRRRHRKS